METSARFLAWDLYARDLQPRQSPFEFEVTAPAGQAITIFTPTGMDQFPTSFQPKIDLPAIPTTLP